MQLERIRLWKLQGGDLFVDRQTLKEKYDPSYRLFVPASIPGSTSTDSQGAVVRLPPDAPLYDFGPAQNWRNLFGESRLTWLNPFNTPCGS